MTMTRSIRNCSLASLLSLLLVLMPGLTPAAFADAPQAAQPSQHVVSSAELQNDLAVSIAKRQANIATLENFFSTPKARHVLKSAGMNYEEVRHAVPLLSSQELASLSTRAAKAQSQFKAGALTNLQITYILIALATAVIVLIIVKS